MSRIGCKCGNVIIDITDSLPYKGYIIKDQLEEKLYKEISNKICSYIKAIKTNTKEKWLKEEWNITNSSKTDEDIVNEIIAGSFIDEYKYIYQCLECGRVFIESNKVPNKFQVFLPEDNSIKSTNILSL